MLLCTALGAAGVLRTYPAMFMVVKGMNRMKKKAAEAPPAPPVPTAEEKLLVEIRDVLAKGR